MPKTNSFPQKSKNRDKIWRMTKEEMLKKIGELTPEQKDFLRREIKKHSPQAKEKTRVKETDERQSNNKI